MALSEEQIVRYSRQILLKDVGGSGQERLLSAPVAVRGQGAALLDAAAYLSAGGSPVTEAGAGCISEWPQLPSGEGAWVLVQEPRVFARGVKGCARCFELTAQRSSESPGGSVSSSARVVPAKSEGRLDEPVEAGLLGSTAALLYQRAVLGLGEPVVALRVLPSGAWESLPLERCEECR